MGYLGNDKGWEEPRWNILRIALLLSMILTCVALSSFLLTSGVANCGDLTWPFYSEPPLTGLFQDNTQSGQIPNQAIVYGWLFNLPVDAGIQERVFMLGVFALIGVSTFFATFRILQGESVERRLTYVLSGVATVIYVINPITFYYMVDLFLLIGYGFLPLILYVLIRFLHSERTGRDMVQFGLLTGVLIAASSGDPRWAVWDVYFILLVLLTMLALSRFRGALRSLGYLAVSGGSFAALSAFWILPTLAATGQSTLLARPNLSVAFYYSVNQFATLPNALRLQADYWAPTRELFLTGDAILDMALEVAQFVLPFLAVVGVVFFWRRKLILSMLVVWVATLILATAPTSPLSFIQDAYQYLVFEFPFGVAFRTSYKWLLVSVYPTVLLAIFAVPGFDRWIKAGGLRLPRLRLDHDRLHRLVVVGSVIVLLSSSLIAGWPLLTGNARGTVMPEEMSGDYHQVYDLIEDMGVDNDYRILYLPSNPLTGFSVPGVHDSPYLHYLITLLDRGDFTRMGSALSLIGVKYVILDKTEETAEKRDVLLKAQEDLTVAYEGSQLLLLVNNAVRDQVRLSDLAISFAGVDAGATLLTWDDWVQSDHTVADLDRLFAYSQYVIMGEGYPYNLLLTQSTVSEPFLYTAYYGSTWYNVVAYSASNYEMIEFLNKYGLDNWDLDFEKGLVYTNVTAYVPPGFSFPDDAIVAYYDLTQPQTAEEWQEINDEEQYGARQELLWSKDGLEVLLLNSTLGWKTVSSPEIPVHYNSTYTLDIEIMSTSGYEVQFKIAEYDANHTLLRIKSVERLGTGPIYWTTVRMNYEITDPNVSYISVQIWHGANTTQPLPNEIVIRSLKVYNSTAYLETPRTDGSVSIDTSGDYRVSVRALASSQGGILTVMIDGVPYHIKTAASTAQFTWLDLGVINLSAGKHDISILNDDGLNAVNLIMFTEEEKFRDLVDGYEALLAEKILIYVLGDASDGTPLNGEWTVNYDPSLGPVGLYLVVDRTMDVVVAGNHTFTVASDHSSTLVVDGVPVATLDASNRQATVNLSKGNHIITLLTSDPYYALDYMAAFPSSAGFDLDNVRGLHNNNGEVVEVTKVDPSNYLVSLRTNGTVALIFSNPYDSAWTITGGTSEVTPIPVNAAQNVFLVTDIGNLSLTITYSLNKPFFDGLGISFISLAAIAAIYSVFYLKDGWGWKWLRARLLNRKRT